MQQKGHLRSLRLGRRVCGHHTRSEPKVSKGGFTVSHFAFPTEWVYFGFSIPVLYLWDLKVQGLLFSLESSLNHLRIVEGEASPVCIYHCPLQGG